MAQKNSGKSPRARARQSLRSAYRARGRGNANLWLVRSVKTERDWLIPSDRALVHWLHFLETDPKIATFCIEPSPEEMRTRGFAEIESAAAVARTHDGLIEIHRIYENDEVAAADSTASDELNGARLVKVCAATDLRSCSRHAFRWLNALAYANAIGKESHEAAFGAVGGVIQRMNCGSVGDVTDTLELHAAPIVIGVLVHLAVSGSITLDLGAGPLARSTQWSLGECE